MEQSENKKPKLTKSQADRMDQPATFRQRDYLADLGVEAPENLTKAEASALIEEALNKKDREKNKVTDDQKRRLRFYGIEFDEESLSKREAMRLIDEHKTIHPESESEYRTWKRSLPDWDPFGEVTPTSTKSANGGCFGIICALAMFAGGWIGNKLDGHWFWGGLIGLLIVAALAAKFEDS